jgi:quercetin dioxygenase-like cupin family protein
VAVAACSVTRFDAIDEIDDGGVPYRPVRAHFGIASFGVSSFTGRKAGERIINEHSEEDDQEELYLVLQGRATFELDGERMDAPAGTLVFAEPGVKRTAFAEEDATTVVVVGGKPGKAYEVLGFEVWAPFGPLYEAGEYAEAADRARGAIEAHAEAVGAFFCLACCEALAAARTTRRGASQARARAVGAAAGSRPPESRPRLDPRPARDRRATRGVVETARNVG